MLVSLGCYRFDEYAEGIMVVMMLLARKFLWLREFERQPNRQTNARQSIQYGTKNDSTTKDCMHIRQTEATSKQIENMTQRKQWGSMGGPVNMPRVCRPRKAAADLYLAEQSVVLT